MKKDRSKIAGSINLLAGLWLVISGYFMAMGFFSTTVIIGVLVAFFGLIELSNAESTKWVSWVNGILGAWLLVSPMVISGLATRVTWNNVILGLIILGVAVWSGMSSSSPMGIGHSRT